MVSLSIDTQSYRQNTPDQRYERPTFFVDSDDDDNDDDDDDRDDQQCPDDDRRHYLLLLSQRLLVRFLGVHICGVDCGSRTRRGGAT